MTKRLTFVTCCLAASAAFGCQSGVPAVESCPSDTLVEPTPAAADPPQPVAELPAEPPPEPEPPPEDDSQFAIHEHNDLKISARIGEREPNEDEDPIGYVRIEVAHEGFDEVDVIERDLEDDDCLVEQVEPSIEVIFNDEELAVVDVRARCVLGETIVRVTDEHFVIATWEHEPGLGVLHQDISRYTNNRGLAVTVDKREFYVEAAKLAVYRHSVAWCDKAGLRELLGEGDYDCPVSPRKLKLLERLPLGVPVDDRSASSGIDRPAPSRSP